MKPAKSIIMILLIMVIISFPKMHAVEYGITPYYAMPSLAAAQAVDQKLEQQMHSPVVDAGGYSAAVTGVILSIWAGIALFVVVLSRKLARVEREVADVIKREHDKS